MHDPLTVAFEIRYPWRARPPSKTWPNGYHRSFITIWHKDPETDGTDDSCDWFHQKFSKRQSAYLDELVTNEDDNIRWWFESGDADGDQYEMKRFVHVVARHARRMLRPRPWWRHPRWHVWHWRVQCHPLQAFQRWAFSRCAVCGKPFDWGYSPVTSQWDNHGPRWFRGEPGVAHYDCTVPKREQRPQVATRVWP